MEPNASAVSRRLLQPAGGAARSAPSTTAPRGSRSPLSHDETTGRETPSLTAASVATASGAPIPSAPEHPREPPSPVATRADDDHEDEDEDGDRTATISVDIDATCPLDPPRISLAPPPPPGGSGLAAPRTRQGTSPDQGNPSAATDTRIRPPEDSHVSTSVPAASQTASLVVTLEENPFANTEVLTSAFRKLTRTGIASPDSFSRAVFPQQRATVLCERVTADFGPAEASTFRSDREAWIWLGAATPTTFAPLQAVVLPEGTPCLAADKAMAVIADGGSALLWSNAVAGGATSRLHVARAHGKVVLARVLPQQEQAIRRRQRWRLGAPLPQETQAQLDSLWHTEGVVAEPLRESPTLTSQDQAQWREVYLGNPLSCYKLIRVPRADGQTYVAEQLSRAMADPGADAACQLPESGDLVVRMTFLPGTMRSLSCASVGQLLSVMGQLAQQMATLHRRGKVHGDIKPGNIGFDPEGKLHLIDFGANRAIGEEGAATPGYDDGMARFSPDVQCDIFAAGWSMIVGILGRRPNGVSTLFEDTAGNTCAPMDNPAAYDTHQAQILRQVSSNLGDRTGTAEERGRCLELLAAMTQRSRHLRPAGEAIASRATPRQRRARRLFAPVLGKTAT